MKSTAFIFPGQGSQSVGMLKELSDAYPLFLDTFNKASEKLGYDLWHLIQNGPEEQLNQTEYTQAAMLTADVAVFRLLQQHQKIAATMMAGHSLGEYAALVCADAITLEDAVQLVALRGRLMQKHIPVGKGAMAAIIGMDDDAVKALCEKVSNAEAVVSPANYNAIGQVVIAGHTSAVEKAVLHAEEHGARMAKIIPVSVPCHCDLLKEAAEEFAGALDDTSFSAPNVPVISNVDLSIYQSPQQIKELLTEQLFQPVRWVETIQLMKQKGVELLIECGPGKVLTGLVKRIDKTMDAMAVNDPGSFEKLFSQF